MYVYMLVWLSVLLFCWTMTFTRVLSGRVLGGMARLRLFRKVVNELLRRALGARRELLELIYSEKVRELSQEELEEFRRELSGRFEDR